MEHSERVISFIENSGDTTYKVAKAAGISQSTFSKWRTKPTSKIDSTILEKIANFYGVTIDEIIGNEQKNKPPMLLDDLSPHELELIKMLREGPEDVTAAVYRAVGIDPEEK